MQLMLSEEKQHDNGSYWWIRHVAGMYLKNDINRSILSSNSDITTLQNITSQVQQRSRDVGGSPECPCLVRGDCCPPGKGCNRAGPSSREEAGVLHPLLNVPKKGGGLRQILDLQVLNRALHKFKMRTRRRIIKCIQPQDWFAAIDLSLSPHVFTKVVEGDLAPLREVGVRILNLS